MSRLIRPITFIDKLVKKNELSQPFRLMGHQLEVLSLAFDFDRDGWLPWDTILYAGDDVVQANQKYGWSYSQLSAPVK